MFASTLTHNKLNEYFPHMVKRSSECIGTLAYMMIMMVMNNYVYETQAAFYSALQPSIPQVYLYTASTDITGPTYLIHYV